MMTVKQLIEVLQTRFDPESPVLIAYRQFGYTDIKLIRDIQMHFNVEQRDLEEGFGGHFHCEAIDTDNYCEYCDENFRLGPAAVLDVDGV